MVCKLKKKRPNKEKGASMVEYALVVALIAIVVLGAMKTVGKIAQDNFDLVGDNLDSSSAPLKN